MLNTFPSLTIAHLLLRLRPLNRTLRIAVERQKQFAAQLMRPDLSPLCLTDEHVTLLLKSVEKSQSTTNSTKYSWSLSPEESSAENEIRSQAAAQGLSLALDQLANDIHLSEFEQQVLLVCAAAELDRSYERIYAFLLDDLNRRFPCVELFATLTSTNLEEQLSSRQALSSFGRLRRYRLLIPVGAPPSELRQEFQLGPDVFMFLTGSGMNVASLCQDRAEVSVPENAPPPCSLPARQFERMVRSLSAGTVSTIGIWGPGKNGSAEVVKALSCALRRPLRRLSVFDLEEPAADPARVLQAHVRAASGLRSLLWIDVDGIAEPNRDRLQRLLAEIVATSQLTTILTGNLPWRPDALLQSDGYTELELSEPLLHQREQIWSTNFPELETDEITSLSSRFGLGSSEIHSVSKLARTQAWIAGNGQPDSVRNHLHTACSMVMRRSTSHFASVIPPKRGPEDLVLRPDLHAQVIEVAKFHSLRQRVDQDWGFCHLNSAGGMKALFTGEPGTGKTLAAEVIAGLLNVTLYKVDLARIVSKWVGETEKNLEAAFREAEDSLSVLLFDEAEALFGSRSEVQHGADRYANLEVSYLLQRLESSTAPIVLASNVKDLIDSAFVRRFQIVVHFPRPALPERRRIWQNAFPKSAPVSADVDLEALANLDMTGAAIVGTARSAAMLAADAGSSVVSMADVVRATARQFRREARVLTPSDLGSYKSLLQGVS